MVKLKKHITQKLKEDPEYDVAMILGLSSLGVPVTGWTTSSVDALKAECMLNFGVEPGDGDLRQLVSSR
ncbi:hypothetical protein PIB30_010806 [Stylosanthes scabra]|uniref:Uncharacterized protein n=1 Tax=Stylosanthes scabra TaxID=79078 RepID=A0ABU6Q5H3_9FABA|nr:hypothetical protein [Stylosanthes scabra]